MNSDKLQCILAVTSTLRQLIQSIRRDPNVNGGPRGDGPIAVGERNGEVTFTECSDFIDLVTSLFCDAEGNFEELQGLMLNTDPTLIPTLVSVLTISPAIMSSSVADAENGDGDDDHQQRRRSAPTDTTPFEKLVISAIQSVLQIITVGCVDTILDTSNSNANGGEPSSPMVAPEGKRLSEMLGAMFRRTELSHCLSILLDAASAPSAIVRFGAAKLLYTAVLRVPAVKASLAANQTLLDGLFDAALSEGHNKIRSYIVGALREVAGSHPTEMTQSDDNIRAFARLFATDTMSDVRTLSAEAVDVIYRNQPQRWGKCGAKKDLATAIIGRLEAVDGETSEALVAILRLLETLLIADAALTLGKPQITPSSSNATTASFTELFVNANGERSIVIAIKGTSESDSLASRCLRLLIEFAPYFCEVAYNAARHFPTVSVVLKAVVALASDASDLTFVSDMRFELSLAVAMMLCQDPRVRQLLSDELRRNPAWMGKLRGSLLSNLNHSTLSDFSGIRVIDVMGDNLSNIRNVQWEEEAQRPVRDSLEAFMVDQIHRYEEYESRGGHYAAYAQHKGSSYIREVPRRDPNGESLETRLTFVLLTNTVHNTFNANRRQTLPDGREIPRIATTTSAANMSGANPSQQQGGLLEGLGQDAASVQRRLQQQRKATDAATAPTNLDELLGDNNNQNNDMAIINELSRVNKHLLQQATNNNSASGYLPATAGRVPGQTRTSLIREWKSNPKKLEAIKEMAKQVQEESAAAAAGGVANGNESIYHQQLRMQQQNQPANFVAMAKRAASRNDQESSDFPEHGTSYSAHSHSAAHGGGGALPPHPSMQYRNNFVDSYLDPFKEPTRDSFKKPPKPSLNRLVAAANNNASVMGGNTTNNKPYTKFDAALKLCEKAGQHYVPMSEVLEDAVAAANAQNTTVFETTGDGFAKRRSTASGGMNTSSSTSKMMTKRQPKTWCIDDLREGDLFYFAVPLNTLSAFAVDQVRVQAVRHLNHLKRSYLVVPNNMKGRRWFIFDMSTFVMPQVIAALDDVLELMEVHGEQNCRFPLLMFKEGGGGGFEGVNSTQHYSGVGAHPPPAAAAAAVDGVPEATLNSGNLFESLDQLRFYFSKMSEVNPVAATASATIPSPSKMMGMNNTSVVNGNTSQYLVDLEGKIRALKNRQFEPKTDAKFMHSFGGAGPSAVISMGGGGPSAAAAAGDDGADEDDYDETTAVPYSQQQFGGRQQTAGVGSSSPPSLSAARARAMLSYGNDDDEIEAVEPLGTTGVAHQQQYAHHHNQQQDSQQYYY